MQTLTRPNRPAVLALLSLLAFSALAHRAQSADDSPPTAKPIELRVLYAGKPDSARMQSFATFLQSHFSKVQTSDYEAFRPEDAKDFDVVILDWPSIYNRDANGKVVPDVDKLISQPHTPEIGKDFTRPTILIGSIAGTIGNQLQLAITWKCLCLEDFDHDLVENHPIFHEPLPVDLQLSEHEKPLDYLLHPGTEKLGESMRVWQVQTKMFPEIDPGLVSSREEFANTPDTEVISGGFNGKGPTSVAIGRHANYLQWGFSADPVDMTESARNAFVNAVCYIHKFDRHQAGPVPPYFGTRDSFLERIYAMRGVTDPYLQKEVEEFRQMAADSPAPPEMMKQVEADPTGYFRKMLEPFVKEVLHDLPQSVRDECHDDPEELIKYYRENLEYLRRPDGTAAFIFTVDDDAREIGVSNRSREILKKCVTMLEKQNDSERAQRILERYTGRSLQTAPEWRKWLNDEGKSLQFDESKGVFVRAATPPAGK